MRSYQRKIMKKINLTVIVLFLLLAMGCETPILTEYLQIIVSGNVEIDSPEETEFKTCVTALVLVSSKEHPANEPYQKKLNTCETTEINRDGSFELTGNYSLSLKEGKQYRVIEVSIDSMSTKVYETESPGVFRKNRYRRYEKDEVEIEQSGRLTKINFHVNFLRNGHTLLRKLESFDLRGKLLGISHYERDAKLCLELSRYASFTEFEYDLSQFKDRLCTEETFSLGAEGDFNVSFDKQFFIPIKSQNIVSKLWVTTNPFNDGILNEKLLREKTYYSSNSLNQSVTANEIQLSGEFVFGEEEILTGKTKEEEISEGCVTLSNTVAIRLCMQYQVEPPVARNCSKLPDQQEDDCIKSFINGR